MQGVTEFVEEPVYSVSLHFLQGYPIHPGGPTVLTHTHPCPPQDVTPVDTVEQGMEASARRLLCSSP